MENMYMKRMFLVGLWLWGVLLPLDLRQTLGRVD